MQLISILSTVCALTSLAHGAAIKPKFVKFDVQHKTGSSSLQKRDSPELSFIDNYSYYLTKIKVGSDSQEMDVLLDTGSNGLFVIDSGSCSSCSDGTFDSSSSSSYTSLDDEFSVNYGSGAAKGTWAKDKIVLGGATVSSQQFAVATTYPADFGVLGLTVSPDETNSDPSYENFPKRLKTDGTIDKVLFSFYPGDYGDNQGSILFGAVDHSKYISPMYSIDMETDTTTVSVQGVNLDSSYSGVDAQVLYSDDSVTALIDTGTSTTLLPTDAFNKLIDALGATKSGSSYHIDCDLLDEDIKLNYNFSGVRIQVPLKDVVYKTGDTCTLGLASTDSRLIFGANALRSAYTVFDLEDKKIGIAQLNTSPGDENIEAVTSIPSS